MSEKSKKELKKSVKECSSAMQTFSEDFAEALKSNTLSNHLTEQADADLQMKVIVKLWLQVPSPHKNCERLKSSSGPDHVQVISNLLVWTWS